MSIDRQTSAAQWRELIDMVQKSIPAPEQVLDQLVHGYDAAAVARAQRAADRMLLPRPCRPRVSPSSLHVLVAAHDFGCFFQISPLRASLVPQVSKDERWQSGYLQQHMVVEAASGADSNVEVHDLVHSMLGLMWWPSISRHDFYLASRLSEATAAYHYYFLDQVLEPRCATHRNIVDLARIWKFNVCPDCNLERNRYYNLSTAQQHVARSVGLECIRQASAFYLTELEDIAAQAVDGVRFIERNPVNLAANAADALRYAHYMLPILAHPRLRPYLDAMQGWQKYSSYEAYLHRATAVIEILNGYRPSASEPRANGEVMWRRRNAVAQDLLLRIGIVLAQHDLELRALHPAEVELLEGCVARTADLERNNGDTAHGELVRVFEALGSPVTEAGTGGGTARMDAVQTVAAVGYEPALALRAATAAGNETPPVPTADLAHVIPMLAVRVSSALPRTVRYLRGAGVYDSVLAAFRDGQERWASIDAAPGDGLVPHEDKIVQRFLLLLARISQASTELANAAEVAYEIGRVEHEYARFQVRARVDLDLRDDPVERDPDDEVVLRVTPATHLHPSTVDIDQMATGPTPGGPGSHAAVANSTYVFSVIRNRTYLTRLPGPLGELLGGLRHRPITAAGLRAAIEGMGASPDGAIRLVRQWLKLGVLTPQPTSGVRNDDEPAIASVGA